ncbi:MAG: hypothetical protein IKF78_14260 [Atopobiaceae bacterium]|nr:hypothetical protein [Atopobiaceae bacterium]
MTNFDSSALRYDFSHLSKRRLQTFNMLAEELERMEQPTEYRELNTDELDILAAAGTIVAPKNDLHGE